MPPFPHAKLAYGDESMLSTPSGEYVLYFCARWGESPRSMIDDQLSRCLSLAVRTFSMRELIAKSGERRALACGARALFCIHPSYDKMAHCQRSAAAPIVNHTYRTFGDAFIYNPNFRRRNNVASICHAYVKKRNDRQARPRPIRQPR